MADLGNAAKLNDHPPDALSTRVVRVEADSADTVTYPVYAVAYVRDTVAPDAQTADVPSPHSTNNGLPLLVSSRSDSAVAAVTR